MLHSLDTLVHAVTGVTGEGVVKVPDEVVAVVLRECHERTAHHDELHLVDTVSQLLQLDGTRTSYIYGVEGNKLEYVKTESETNVSLSLLRDLFFFFFLRPLATYKLHYCEIYLYAALLLIPQRKTSTF